MKRMFPFLAVVLVSASVFAQSPQKMSYQAVIRNSSNQLISNQQIAMQISILQGSASGTAVYTETQSPITNSNGLISIEVGGGTIVSGNFASIDWANGPYFLKTETDPLGGGNYTITGTSELLSVPYAKFAEYAGNVTGQVLSISNDTLYLNNDTYVVLPDTSAYSLMAGTFNKLSTKGSETCNAENEGQMRYNASTRLAEYCNGSKWIVLGGSLSLLTTDAISSITINSAISGGSVSDNGGAEIIEKGICWNTTGTPTTSDSKTKQGNGSDAFVSNLSDLTSNTIYYVRAYATNTAGTGYGDEKSFAALANVSVTDDPVFISYTSFTTGGTVDAGGGATISERGIVYGLNSNPTKADYFVSSGSGPGSFTVTITDIQDNGYYYRAYAVNEGGISYGPEKSFEKQKKTIDFNGTLYVYPVDNSNGLPWSGNYVNTGALSSTDGETNTTKIVNIVGVGNYAAKLCSDLNAYGYDDWYLPASGELYAIFQNKNTIGGSFSTGNYWSSTESDYYYALGLNFLTGIISYNVPKYTILNVRCVRRD